MTRKVFIKELPYKSTKDFDVVGLIEGSLWEKICRDICYCYQNPDNIIPERAGYVKYDELRELFYVGLQYSRHEGYTFTKEFVQEVREGEVVDEIAEHYMLARNLLESL